jgi:hypothetical protein
MRCEYCERVSCVRDAHAPLARVSSARFRDKTRRDTFAIFASHSYFSQQTTPAIRFKRGGTGQRVGYTRTGPRASPNRITQNQYQIRIRTHVKWCNKTLFGENHRHVIHVLSSAHKAVKCATYLHGRKKKVWLHSETSLFFVCFLSARSTSFTFAARRKPPPTRCEGRNKAPPPAATAAIPPGQ